MRFALLAVCLGFLVVSPARALEVDPYLAWLEDIPDSAQVLNEYTTAMVSGHVQSLAERGLASGECAEVAVSSLRYLHRSVLTRRRALAFLKKSPEVSKWKGGGAWSSVWRSYYRRLVPLYFSSLAKTIDVNGVRMSLDKVGHFFSYGRRYYQRYRRGLARGMTPGEAEQMAILWGISQENLFVGKWIDTIFSHADLEANYQGLRFARDLCEGGQPYLTKSGGVWSLTRTVDLRDYINPGFDEGYNNNHFTWIGWALVRKRLEKHCWILNEPMVQDRLAYYQSFPSSSVSQTTIREFFRKRGGNPQERHSLSARCDRPSSPPRAAGPDR